MSNYNIQLQSNNTDLQEVLELLQTKATGGVKLPELTNPASSAEIVSGYDAIDANGNRIDGSLALPTNVNVTFASNGFAAKYYYTQYNQTNIEHPIENKSVDQTSSSYSFTISMIANSILYCNQTVFDGISFDLSNLVVGSDYTKISNQAIIVHKTLTLPLADGAPT